MRYKFYVDFAGFQKEIYVEHKPLVFSWEKYNDRVSYNFVKTLNTELRFIDHPTKENTDNKIWKSYTYVKSSLDASTSKLNIAVYLADNNEFFWRGSVLLFSENNEAWDLNKKVFKEKASEINTINPLTDLGDIEVNIQEITQKFTATDSDLTEYDNGMTINSVFQYIFQKVGIEWNVATNIIPIASTLGLDDILIYDKSDAKRPGATQNATITNVKLNNLIQNVCDLFNVKFEVVNNTFQFKHYTERTPDSVDINDKIKGIYNNSFSFISIPAIETLKCEEANTDGFTEYTINYDIDNNKKESYKLSDLCVDLDFIIENQNKLTADPDAKDDISDSGLFFAGVQNLEIQDLNGKKNGVLAYENLFPELWAGERYLPRYSINNDTSTYRATKRKIKEMEFSMFFFNSFNPVFLHSTQYGTGEIQSAELNGNKMSLKLLL